MATPTAFASGDPYLRHVATAIACLTALASPSSTALPETPSIPQRVLRTVLDETFIDNRGSWPDDREATAWLLDRGYHLYTRHPGHFVAISAPMVEPHADVIVTATFRKVGGLPGGGYGLILRDQGPGRRNGLDQGGRYYVLEVGDRGEVGIWRREEDHWVDLVPWTPSRVVRACGATNQVTARSVGLRLTLAVNGVEVASVEDVELREGSVGIFVGGDLNEVVLERLIVQIPD